MNVAKDVPRWGGEGNSDSSEDEAWEEAARSVREQMKQKVGPSQLRIERQNAYDRVPGGPPRTESLPQSLLVAPAPPRQPRCLADIEPHATRSLKDEAQLWWEAWMKDRRLCFCLSQAQAKKAATSSSSDDERALTGTRQLANSKPSARPRAGASQRSSSSRGLSGSEVAHLLRLGPGAAFALSSLLASVSAALFALQQCRGWQQG